jgi:hypothetical protein
MRKGDHSPPFSAEVKECVELYLYYPNTPSGGGAQLKKHSDNFTFTFFINRLFFATETRCVFWEVRTELLHIKYLRFSRR